MQEFSLESFVLKLRALRHSKGYKQTEMARLFKIGRDIYSKYESGKAESSYSFLRRASMLFGVSADELLRPLDKQTAIKLKSLLTARELKQFESLLSQFDLCVTEPVITVAVRKRKTKNKNDL